MNESMKHDHAWAGAVAVLGVFENLLREEEKEDAAREVYLRIRAVLESFEQAHPLELKLQPSPN